MSTAADPASLRRLVYALLIVVAMAGILGRILSVANVVEPHLSRSDPGQSAAAILLPLAATSTPETIVLLAAGQSAWSEIDDDEPARLWPRTRPRPVPSLGGNDRSRWATVRALVDDGRYAIGWRVQHSSDPKDYTDYGIITENGWQTLDRVLHPDRLEFYSSKPPLYPTLLAGEYWLLKHVLGWSIADKDGRWQVIRTILVTVNWLPMLIYLILLARLAERFGTTDWGRLYVVAAAAFATFMTPFAIVLNNHTIAACSALFALYAATRTWEPSREMPASGSPLNFLLAGFFAGFAATCELPAASFLAALFVVLVVRAPVRTLFFFVPAAALPIAGLLLTNYLAIGEVVPAYSKLESPWYQFEGGYWRPDPAKRGIDWAWQRESKVTYAFHLLLGHHGLFSLTPIWLLALAGAFLALWRADAEWRRSLWTGPIRGTVGPGLVIVSALTIFLTGVVGGFYLFAANKMSNNYGGMTCGPRWFLWLTPFWLLTLLPAADRLGASRWGRVVGYVLLGISVLSVSYPAWNPWRHPWIYNWFESLEWIRY